MAFIKWLFILVSGVVMLIVGGGWGVAHYVTSTPTLQITRADLQPGAKSIAAERDAFAAACAKRYTKKFGAKAQNACNCIVIYADTNFSRYDKLASTAAYNGDVASTLSLAKGLYELNLSQIEINQMTKGFKSRLEASEARCTRGMI